MNWLTFAVQWLHVLLGILWFGYSLSMFFLITPPLRSLPEETQRAVFRQLGTLGARVFPVVGILVLVLGFVRGTFLGPIKGLDAFGTAYGITWLVALLATIGLFYTGARYLGPGFAALADAADFSAAGERVRRVAGIDLVIFFVIFTCMILMRFGQ
ncbi:MAG TPA: hypothetical protein VIA82_10710 [Candidatus Limnocylindria bacterium]|jgi:uncharacterized membrane protein